MSQHTISAWAALLGATLALAACGGGEGEGGNDTPMLGRHCLGSQVG